MDLLAVSSALPATDVTKAKAGGLGRAVLVSAVLLAAAMLIHFTPIRGYLSDIEHLRARLLHLGVWAYPATVALVALLLAGGVPRLPIHVAGGAIFGFWMGLVLTVG